MERGKPLRRGNFTLLTYRRGNLTGECSALATTESTGMNVSQHRAGEARSIRKQRGHTLPRRPNVSLDEPGWLRVGHLLWILGVSHSTLYSRLKSGRYPPPDGEDGGRPVWHTRTIRSLVNFGRATQDSNTRPLEP